MKTILVDDLPVGGILTAIGCDPRGVPRAQRPNVSAVRAEIVERGRHDAYEALRWTDRLLRGNPPPVLRTRLQVERNRVRNMIAKWNPTLIDYHLDRALSAVPGGLDVVFACRVGPNLVVTTGLGYIVDAWQGTVELEAMRYHGCGTGSTAPAAGNTALEAESTTIINPNNTRATGSLIEGASASIFRTEGSMLFDGSGTITEWGLFNQAATGGGVMMARRTFTGISISAGLSIFFAWEAQFSAS